MLALINLQRNKTRIVDKLHHNVYNTVRFEIENQTLVGMWNM